MIFFAEVIIYQFFRQETWFLLVFVTLQILVLFFLCFSAFSEFQCAFCNTFVLTFITGIFYLILVCRVLKSIQLKENVFSTHFQQIYNTK